MTAKFRVIIPCTSFPWERRNGERYQAREARRDAILVDVDAQDETAAVGQVAKAIEELLRRGGEAESENDSGIAARVYEVMQLRVLGFNEMDRLLGKSEGYTSRLVKENRTPRADVVRTIVEKLTINADWLLRGIGEP